MGIWVTVVASKVTGVSCISRVSSISTMTVVTVKVMRSSKDRGGYGSGESVHNRGNSVHGGNGQRNFSIGVFVEDSLEGSLGLSNLGQVSKVSSIALDCDMASICSLSCGNFFSVSQVHCRALFGSKGNMSSSLSIGKSLCKGLFGSLDLCGVFKGDGAGNSQKGSENESLHD